MINNHVAIVSDVQPSRLSIPEHCIKEIGYNMARKNFPLRIDKLYEIIEAWAPMSLGVSILKSNIFYEKAPAKRVD